MTATKYDRYFLGILFIGGILHWLVFCFLVTPGDYLDFDSMRDSQFIGMLNDPISWFNYREFTVNDWVKDIKYLKIFKEALHNGQVPFHVPGYLDGVGEGIERIRYLAWSSHRSPQLLFLYFLEPFTYFVVNLLLMYSIGFFGCLLIRKHYHLGLLPFTFLFH